MASSAEDLTRLCDMDDVEEDEPFRAEIDGVGYAVFQLGDDYYVVADLCTHGPGHLSDGFVDGFEVECPFHQGQFDLRTGAPTAPPCEVAIRTWKPVVRDGGIHINVAIPKAAGA